MDTEEKKNTLPPRGKGRKRRKKKPAAGQGNPAPRERAAQETVSPLTEDTSAPAESAPESGTSTPEVPAQAPMEEKPASVQETGESAARPLQEDSAPEANEEPERNGQAAPAEESEPVAMPESAEPAETPEETADAGAAAMPPEEKKTEDTEPLPEDWEDPLPDGVAVSEVDLSDALDRMMQETPEKAGSRLPLAAETVPAGPEEKPAEPEVGEPAEPPEEAEHTGTDGDGTEDQSPAEAQDETEGKEKGAEAPEPAEQSGEEEESGEDAAEAPDGTDAEAPGEEIPEEDGEKRLSDLTRTVQLSVEQIMAGVADETSDAAEQTTEEEAEEPPATLRDHLRNGVSGMCKWLLLVVFFVLVIAGGGVAWLYRSATPDMVPVITVSFDGQTVQPAAYKWKVPVVGNLFKRTYADTLSSVPVALESAVEQSSPHIEISPSDYRTELTVTDSADNVIFDGDVESFAAYQFAANGQYTAKLVVYVDQSTVSGAADVSGSETWLFDFELSVRASVHLNSETVDQGSVAAVRVGSTLDGQPPRIETELENAGFFPAGVGWVCYLPIPWNQAARDYAITVTAGGHAESLTLEVRAADWEHKDYSSDSQRAQPYIGDADMPAEVKSLLADSDAAIAWTNSNFVQPLLRSLNVKLAYGTTEYVGRSYSERDSNTGAGGRTAINTILNTTRGELLIAPANGTVRLAKDLGGVYGNTLVIDHGAGVKSIFYGLSELEVKTGDALKQGQTLATCGSTTVAELRIGDVPVDPLPVWRGQCDALKYY